MTIGKCLNTCFSDFSLVPHPYVRLSPHRAFHQSNQVLACGCSSTLITRASSVVPLLSLGTKDYSFFSPLFIQTEWIIPSFRRSLNSINPKLRCWLCPIKPSHACNMSRIFITQILTHPRFNTNTFLYWWTWNVPSPVRQFFMNILTLFCFLRLPAYQIHVLSLEQFR